MDRKDHWTYTLTTAIILSGILLEGNLCESCTNGRCYPKHVLVDDTNTTFPNASRYESKPCCPDIGCSENHEFDFCVVDVKENVTATTDHCYAADSPCALEVQKNGNKYNMTLNLNPACQQDIRLRISHGQNVSCMPHHIYNSSARFRFVTMNKSLLKLNIGADETLVAMMSSRDKSRSCSVDVSDFAVNLDKYPCTVGGVRNIQIHQNTICEDADYGGRACRGKDPWKFILTISSSPNGQNRCVTCLNPVSKPEINITLPSLGASGGVISADMAADALGNLSFLLSRMGNASTAAILMGNVKGLINRLPKENQTAIHIGFSPDSDMNIVENQKASQEFSRYVRFSKESVAMAVNRGGSFAGILVFPNMSQDERKSIVLNNEVVGIEMGAEISNLTDAIDIQYRNVDKGGADVSCNSWNGEGKKPNWTTDGCQTKQSNNSVTCQCTHLSFFAILMSPPPGNMSSSEMTSLTYITNIGCGLSMFFLGIGLFMQALIRRRKSSQATQILTNLFLAMFLLNMSFLVDEPIANLGSFGGCVVMAAVLHYTMLATFTWFFIEALHLYLQLRGVPAEIKRYMLKICIAGWVIPALVVVPMIIAGKYGLMSINTDDGNSVKMCWITDAIVHEGVNLGYYAVVFLFTLVVFITVIRQMVFLESKAGNGSTTRVKTLSILGLLFLLGIPWGFAFFSHGPLIIPSYYIFTIINTLQGFFLFIYYYNTSKIVGEDGGSATSVKSSTCSESEGADQKQQ